MGRFYFVILGWQYTFQLSPEIPAQQMLQNNSATINIASDNSAEIIQCDDFNKLCK